VEICVDAKQRYNRAGVRFMLIRPTAVLFLTIIISAGCLAQSAPQPKQSQTSPSSKVDAAQADLRAVVARLNEDSETLLNLASPLVGSHDADNASSIVSAIQLAMTETGGASWLIEPSFRDVAIRRDAHTMVSFSRSKRKFRLTEIPDE
jgi:hypothetical protein